MEMKGYFALPRTEVSPWDSVQCCALESGGGSILPPSAGDSHSVFETPSTVRFDFGRLNLKFALQNGEDNVIKQFGNI